MTHSPVCKNLYVQVTFDKKGNPWNPYKHVKPVCENLYVQVTFDKKGNPWNPYKQKRLLTFKE